MLTEKFNKAFDDIFVKEKAFKASYSSDAYKCNWPVCTESLDPCQCNDKKPQSSSSDKPTAND